MKYVAFILVWYLLGLVGAGFVYSDNLYNYASVDSPRSEAGFCVPWALGGPVSLVIGYTSSGFGEHGWWKTYTIDNWKEAGKK